MTDRVRVLTVILEDDMRDDDVEHVVNAIRMIRRVADVRTQVVTASDYLNRVVAKQELRKQILDGIFDILKVE